MNSNLNMNNHDAANIFVQNVESLSFKRKRLSSSAGVKADVKPLGIGTAAQAALNASCTDAILRDIIVPVSRIKSATGPLKHDPKPVCVPTKPASSHDHHARKLPTPAPMDQEVLHQCPTPGSNSGSRPRKQPRGLLPGLEPGLKTEEMSQKKLVLIDKLRSYAPCDDGGFVDDDEGDVSGEDVFSEDEEEGHLHMIPIKGDASAFPSSYMPLESSCVGGESQRRITAGVDSERSNQTSANRGAGGNQPPLGWASSSTSASITSSVVYGEGSSFQGVSRETERGGAGQKQPSRVYQSSITEQTRYLPSSSATGNIGELPHQGRAANVDAKKHTLASRSRTSGERAPPETAGTKLNHSFRIRPREGRSTLAEEKYANDLKVSAIQTGTSSFVSASLAEDRLRRLTGTDTRSLDSRSASQKKAPLEQYYSSNSTTRNTGESSYQGRASCFDGQNSTQPSKISDHAARQSSQDGVARMHPNIRQPHTWKQDGVENPTASYSRENSLFHSRTSSSRKSISPQDDNIVNSLMQIIEKTRNISGHAAPQSSQDAVARMHPSMHQPYTWKQDGVENPTASYSRENTVSHNRTSSPRIDISPQDDNIVQALLKIKEKSRAMFDMQHSLSTSSRPFRNSLNGSNGPSPPSNLTASVTAFHGREIEVASGIKIVGQHANSTNDLRSRASLSIGSRTSSQVSESIRYRDMSLGNVDLGSHSLPTINPKAFASNLDSVRQARQVIAKIEAAANRNLRSPRPSRDVIANIEANMMRLDEDEGGMAEMDNIEPQQYARVDINGPGIRSGSTYSSRQPAGMNERDLLIEQGRPQHASRDGTLVDRISNMALEPLRLRTDDNSSAKSIGSWESYDGKCTNICASYPQTPDQELACHTLSNATSDLYSAPVGRILSQHPTVTRLIQAGDETGNVQLHYAVRNGNVKAVRRILRADPDCALIRNVQGYCPLHFAVQIGNFGAVQLLCCMAPKSARVQCEEGYLPLHEALSSAAHLEDAPQIAAALISAFPSAIKITNDEGLLPLHLAAMSGFSAGIRTVFAYGFNTIYARENTEEMLPIDFAIDGYKTSTEEAKESRQDSHEEQNDVALTEKEMEFRRCIDIFLMSALYDRPVYTTSTINDQRGMPFLPLHGAAASQSCSQSWKQLVSMYGVDYASEVDVFGRTALHVLVTSELYRLDVVSEMITDIDKLDPTSATTYDDSGVIPLHAALIFLAPYNIIEHLLRCSWGAISMEVDEDCDSIEFRGMLPFQLAAACGCSIGIVNLLLRSHPIGISGAMLKNEDSNF